MIRKIKNFLLSGFIRAEIPRARYTPQNGVLINLMCRVMLSLRTRIKSSNTETILWQISSEL